METIISNLIRDFENGKMNRRQLIRSLALAAVGGHALGAAVPAAASAAIPAAASAAIPAAANAVNSAAPLGKTAGLGHISYSVADYGRSRDFYSDLMGWEVRRDDGERQASLAIGDVGSIIIRNSRQPTSQSRPNRPPLTGVINHISWQIENFDTDEVREELERRGLNPRRDQAGGEGYDSYHVLDPDGWDLQIQK